MAVSAWDKKTLGEWIRQLRQDKAPPLSQRRLALAAGITNAALSSIENGMIFPSEELLLKLVEQLQPNAVKKEEIFALFAEARKTIPPDISAKLKKEPALCEVIRQIVTANLSNEQIDQVKQYIQKIANEDGG